MLYPCSNDDGSDGEKSWRKFCLYLYLAIPRNRATSAASITYQPLQQGRKSPRGHSDPAYSSYGPCAQCGCRTYRLTNCFVKTNDASKEVDASAGHCCKASS